jgi:hypothetical protein
MAATIVPLLWENHQAFKTARVALWVFVPIFCLSMEWLLSRTTSRSNIASQDGEIRSVFRLLL